MSLSDPNFWLAVTAIATAIYTFATIALVFVTITNVRLVRRYTETTAQTVEEMAATRIAQTDAVQEMRRTREAEIAPVLVPYTELLDPRQPQVHFGVKNVGRGPALTVDVIIRWTELMRFRLRCPVLEPGQSRLVKTGQRGDVHPDAMNPETVDDDERVLVLTGTCRDAAGTVHAVDVSAPFFDRWEHNISAEMEAALQEEWRALRERPPS